MQGDEPSRPIEGTALLSEAVALDWPEAVAVVLLVADNVKKTPGGVVPDLVHVRLAEDGVVTVLPGSPVPDDPIDELAAMLRLLLEGKPAPPPLKQFAARVDKDLAGQSVEAFTNALHYYERPFRDAILSKLVNRVADIEAQPHIEEELARLQAKARDAAIAAAHHAMTPTTGADRRRVRHPRLLAAGIVVLALAGASATIYKSFRPKVVTAGTQVGTAISTASQRASKAIDTAVGRLLGAPEPGAETPDATKPANDPPKSSRTSKVKPPAKGNPNAAGGGAPTAHGDTPALTPPAPIPSRPDDVLVDDVVTIGPPLVAPLFGKGDVKVYTALDNDVTPPVPQEPTLGHPTNRQAGASGAMDLIIDERGNVERVQLSGPSLFEPRMLVYAVKARRYKPATKDGKPVKYLLHITVGR